MQKFSLVSLFLFFLFKSHSQCNLNVTVTSTNVTCNGLNNGQGEVQSTGANGSVTIQWQPSLYTSATVNNLAPGVHTVTVTDANNCVASSTILIVQPQPFQINSLFNTSSNCGQSNGSASVTVSGGTLPYNYQWNSNPTFTQSVLQNVVAGNYTITITDQNGCQVSAITAINDMAAPSITSVSSSSVVCFNQNNGYGGVSAVGFGALTYSWSYQGQTTPTVTNLPAGTHTVTVTDAASCFSSYVFTLTQASQALAVAIASFTNVTCNGFSNGGATANLSNGVPPYSYTWTPSFQSSSVLSGALAGTYTVNISDANSCTGSATVLISQPAPLIIQTSSVTDVSCNGGSDGSINASIVGGNTPYNIVWSPNVGTGSSVNNLSQGTYTLQVLDNLGCITSSVYTISQPNYLMLLQAYTVAASCGNSNGTGSIVVGGGTAPYSYSWSPAVSATNFATGLSPGVYTVSVTDNKGCSLSHNLVVPSSPQPSLNVNVTNVQCAGMSNGSLTIAPSGVGPFSISTIPGGFSGPYVTGLAPAIYTCTSMDGNGCVFTKTAQITQPLPLVMTVSPHSTVCPGSIATTSVAGSGGVLPYSFTITNNVNSSAIYTSTSSTFSLNNLIGNDLIYQVEMSDANGCPMPSKTVSVTVFKPLIATTDSIICRGQTATLTASGGTGYLWNTGDIVPTITVSPLVTANYSVAISPCSFTAAYTQSVTECAGLFENSLTDMLFVQPNPFTENFVIRIRSTLSDPSVLLIDSFGKIVLTQARLTGETDIDTSNLESGIYTLVILTRAEKIYYKLIRL